MPSIRFSTHFLILLCIKDAETGDYIWDDLSILHKFGITCRPSQVASDPVPAGLTAEKASHIRIFTDSINNRREDDRAEWINDGQECAAGREFYQKWFSSGKSSGLAISVNKVIDAALMQCNVYPGQQVDEERPDEFPSSDAAARDAAADIAGILIGDYRFQKDGMTMRKDVRDAVSSMIRLAYERLKKKWNTSKKTLEPRRKAAIEIMEQIEKAESVSLTTIRQAIAKVASYKNAATLRFGEHERIEVFEASLQELLEKTGKKTSERRQAALSRKGEDRVSLAKIRMAKKVIIKADLSDKDDIHRTWASFVDEFVVSEVGTTLDERPDAVEIQNWEGNLGDCGVDEYQRTTSEELCRLLSFPEGRPRSWARYRSADVSINAWDSPNLPIFEGLRPKADTTLPLPPDTQKVELTWHQLVGIASILSKCFTEGPQEENPGVILGDGVGVGKSAQVMGLIAGLQNIWMSEQPDSNISRPPIVANRRFFMGREGVPNLPHLVVVPNSLVDQWRREWKSFASAFSLDIFEYPTTTDSDFFNSPQWAEESITQNIFRVILMPQSVFQTMSGKVFDTKSTGRKGKPIDCERKVKSDRAFMRSVFNRDFATFFWDEAHDLRSANQKWVGAIQLSKKAHFVCCITATPIYHSPKDVIYIARVVGLPSFCLEDGAELEKRGTTILKAKTLLSAEDRAAIHRITEARLRGEDTSSMYDPSIELRKETITYVEELQEALEGRMIRRTSDSLKPDGTRINDQLGPCTRLVVPVRLPEFEMNQLRGEVDEMHDGETASSSFFDYNNEEFYGPFRTLVGYPYPDETTTKKGKTKRVWPTFATKEQYTNKPGAKLSASIEVVQALLSDDEISLFTFDENDCVKFPLPRENAKRTRKVLIYHEYPMMADTITSAFKVHGINLYVINGTLAPEDRTKIVQQFVLSVDPDWRVLLFSKVGACGLNLACANALVQYDVVWSDVEGIQIVGRIHRMGQPDPVHVYSMIAMGTTDVNMSYTAKFKDDMLNVLVTRMTAKKSDEERKKDEETQKKINNMLNGNVVKEGDAEDTAMDEEPPTKRGRKIAPKPKPKTKTKAGVDTSKKGKGKRRKAVSEDEAEPEVDINGGEGSNSSKTPKRKAEEDADEGDKEPKKSRRDNPTKGQDELVLPKSINVDLSNHPMSTLQETPLAPPKPPITTAGSLAMQSAPPSILSNAELGNAPSKGDVDPNRSSQPDTSAEKDRQNGEEDAHMKSPPRPSRQPAEDTRMKSPPPPSRKPAEDRRMSSPVPIATRPFVSRLPVLSRNSSLFSAAGPWSFGPSISQHKPGRPHSDMEMNDIHSTTGAIAEADTRMKSPSPPHSPPLATTSIEAAIESATDDLLNFEVGKDTRPSGYKSTLNSSPLQSTPRRNATKDITITPLKSRPPITETFGSPGIARLIRPAGNARSRTKTPFESSDEDESLQDLPAIHVKPAVGISMGGKSSRATSVASERGSSRGSSAAPDDERKTGNTISKMRKRAPSRR